MIKRMMGVIKSCEGGKANEHSFVAGIAGLIMGERRGWAGNILVGILGSAVGGFAASLLGWGGVDGFNLYSLLVAVGGACILLWIYNMLQRRVARS